MMSKLNEHARNSETWSKENYEDLTAKDKAVIMGTSFAAAVVIDAAIVGTVWGVHKVARGVYCKIQGRRFVKALEHELETEATNN